MCSKSRPFIASLILIVLLSGTMAFSPYKDPPPIQPDYVPLEFKVFRSDSTEKGQTVVGYPWKATWDVYIFGGEGNYCLYVVWGDSFPNWESCGYASGSFSQISHDFNKPGDPLGTYYQTWRINGVGGPLYDYTYVTKR